MTTDTHSLPRPRRLTAARVVALAVVALVAAGLATVDFVSGEARVGVPPGAKAGQLTMKPCSYATERGDYAADCGTLVVPENRGDPASRLIALPVKRVRARSAGPGVPVFRLEGGPGGTNMRFPQASRLAGARDVVMVGYRGVDGSTRLDCPEVASALKRAGDLLAASTRRAYLRAFRACADRLRDEGADLAGYTLAERADDLEAARAALGYRRVDLLSESAGTRTAMIYTWRHPRSVRRSVMLGANPPGGFVWRPRRTDAQIRRYGTLCEADGACRSRTRDLAATIRRELAEVPARWMLLPVRRGNVRIASFYGMMDSTPEAAPLGSPQTIDTWLGAAEGDKSGHWLQSLAAALILPDAFVWGDVASVARIDAPAAAAYSAGGDRGSILGNPGTELLWAGGRLAAAWPSQAAGDAQYRRMRPSDVETLVVSGSLDFATPPEAARDEVMPHLRNGHHVVLPGFGHTGDFWDYQRRAGARLIGTFLATGEVDRSGFRRQKPDFDPGVKQPVLAKGIAGGMAALAALTLLGLLWLPLRVRRRGSAGRRLGGVVRWGFAPLLGLGGWVLAAVLVLVLELRVPLDAEVLTVISAGVPVALASYWGWVHRAWAASEKRIGLAAALGSALVGAWLAFDVETGLLALLTAIAGACAAANLALVLLDVSDRRA